MRAAEIEIREYSAEDRAGCEAVLATLPDWFGLPEANEAYLADLAVLPAWVAVREGRIVGFASMRVHNPSSVELELLAVERGLHRQGIGRRLVAALEEEIARRPEVRLFHVKTRGPSQPDEGYEKTRMFYEALGFESLFETDALWGPENPALIMVRATPPARMLARKELTMIGYVTLGTGDLERGTAFYDALLAELGAKRVLSNDRMRIWGSGPGKAMLALCTPYDEKPASVGNGVMVALDAGSREVVDRLYAKAMELGASDEGEPGPRGDGSFYGGYFRDPDGNKLVAFVIGS